MRITEAIEKLKDIHKRYGDLELLTISASGSGTVDSIHVELDMIEYRYECVLAETP